MVENKWWALRSAFMYLGGRGFAPLGTKSESRLCILSHFHE